MKLHLRSHGRSRTLEAEPLGMDSRMDDRTLEEILRREGLLPQDDRTPVVIDRHPDALVVRPPAVFG